MRRTLSASDKAKLPRDVNKPTKKKNSAPSANSALKRLSDSIDWIPGLAEPYLRGYTAERGSRGGLHGWWFVATQDSSVQRGATGGRSRRTSGSWAGFFIGYLLSERGWKFLSPHAPEFVIFAFVLPVKGSAHKKLVAAPDSVLRGTFEYIRWLTHRPPRFQFFENETPALIRHIPLEVWPAERIEHYARNFSIETLAWLVRSALVRRLAEEDRRSSRGPQVQK